MSGNPRWFLVDRLPLKINYHFVMTAEKGRLTPKAMKRREACKTSTLIFLADDHGRLQEESFSETDCGNAG